MTVSEWTPAVDISEDDSEWLVQANLPDVKKDDVKVAVETASWPSPESGNSGRRKGANGITALSGPTAISSAVSRFRRAPRAARPLRTSRRVS